MAKTRKKAAATATPEHSAYSMKGIDRQLWTAFVQRAKVEGRTVRWLLDSFIKAYANREALTIESITSAE